MDSYTTIQNYLSDKRQDSTFSPELLEKLSTDERLHSETEIAMFCQKGHKQYFKFIPYFRIVTIENTLTPEVLAEFPEDVKMEALKNLFLKTKNNDYLKDITYSALQNAIAFYNLINLALDDRLTQEEQEAVKEIVRKVYKEKEDDLSYKAIVDFKLANHNNGFGKK